MAAFERFFAEQNILIPNYEYLPSYKVLEMILLAGISKGLWKEGDSLPPERRLANLTGYSVGTVKRTMLELVHQGVLYRKQGSGTFVAGTSFSRQNRRYYLFLKDFHGTESANAIKVVHVRKVSPVPYINAHLHLETSEPLFEIARLFSEDGAACALVKSYVSAEEFSDMDQISTTRLEHVPLYILLEEEYDVTSLKSDELFRAATAREEEAALLGIPPGSPVLEICSLVYTRGDTPFEYRQSFCRTDNKFIYRSME